MDAIDEVKKLRDNIRRMLMVVGNASVCKGCGLTIFWVRTNSGKQAPWTLDALNHFADCPAADRFRAQKDTSHDE